MAKSPKKGKIDENAKNSGPERRKTVRRPVLETFSCFVVVPARGIHRLKVQDVSEGGIGFDMDFDADWPVEFKISKGISLDLRFYLNQSLFIPLTVKVVRVADQAEAQRVGAEFHDKTKPGYKAFLAFLKFLDTVLDSLRIDVSEETGF